MKEMDSIRVQDIVHGKNRFFEENFTFRLVNDEFFLVFRTFLVGYGTVPSERLSNSMITVIAAIIMAPFVILSSSIIYIYYKNTEIPHSVLE